MSKIFKGSCLCGEITFTVTGFSDQAANCHCTMCRKFHGAAYGTLVKVSALKWLSGEGLLQHFTAQNGTARSFCKNCGASLGFRSKGVPIHEMELAIALFDEDIPVIIDAHIYAGYKANWCQPLDNVLTFPAGRSK